MDCPEHVFLLFISVCLFYFIFYFILFFFFSFFFFYLFIYLFIFFFVLFCGQIRKKYQYFGYKIALSRAMA